MFNPKRHAKFFRTLVKASDAKIMKDAIDNASLRELYATLLVIRLVLRGDILVSKADKESLYAKKRQFRLARVTW